MRMRRLVAMVATLVAAGSLTAPVAAQEPVAAPVRLVVTAISGTVGDGVPGARGEDGDHDLRVRVLVVNDGDETLSNLSLLVEVFDDVHSRSELHEALDAGERPDDLLEPTTVEVGDGGDIGARGAAGVEVTMAGEDIGWGEATGLHPVRIAVVQGGTELDSASTAVMVLANEPERSLPTMIGWPLDAAPWRGTGGAYPVQVDDEIRPGGRLDRLTVALERTTTPVQLLLAGHLLEDLDDRSDGFVATNPDDTTVDVARDEPAAATSRELLGRLRDAAADAHAVVPAPYADAHLAGLVDQDLPLEAGVTVAEGSLRIEGLDIDTRTDALWATAPLTTDVIDEVVVPSAVRTVLLGWHQLEAPTDGEMPERTPPAVQLLRSRRGVDLVAVVADPWIENLMTAAAADAGTALAVQRLVAETAMIWLEAPNASGRGLVLLPPPGWDPQPTLPTQLLEGLGSAPWIEPVGLDGLLGAVGPATEIAQLPEFDDVGMPLDLALDLIDVRARLAALQEAIPEGDAVAGGRTSEQLDRALLRVASIWWLQDRPDIADTLVADVASAVDGALGAVEVVGGAQVTLTDTEGTIPIKLRRTTGQRLRVIVSVESARLQWPDGDAEPVTLAAGATRTIPFRFRLTHASGRVPITVRVTTPDQARRVELTQTTFEVQSTAISGTAVGVVGGVLLLLFAWWLYRRRRPPAPQLTVVRERAA